MFSDDGVVAGVPPRLRLLLPLMAEGATNEQMAEEFGYALHTIENYVHDLKDMLGCRDRVALVLTAQRVLRN